EVLEVLQDQVADLVDDSAALTMGHGAPGRAVLERGPGGAHRAGDVFGFAVGDRGELVLGRRVEAVEGAVGRGVHPFAADQQLATEVTLYFLDGGFVNRQGHR